MIKNTKKFSTKFLQNNFILWSGDKSPDKIKKIKELEKILKDKYKNINTT